MGNKNVRLYEHINIDKEEVQEIFYKYDSKLEVINYILIPEGLSTSNYIIEIKNSSKKFLLKIYPEGRGNSEIEVASYNYIKEYVNVPNIYLFDESKTIYNKPYVIMEYINGITLKEYIINNKKFPDNIAYDIGRILALIHKREYKEMGLLDKNLDIAKSLIPVANLHEYYLNGVAGTHIDSKIKNEILEFIDESTEMLKELERTYVYSHGDFYPSNILIENKGNSLWVIDFEYSLSAPIYYDIGKFFRQREEIDKYIEKSTYENFINGYNTYGKNKVSKEWFKLAKLLDMTGMLALINKKNPPIEWVKAIENVLVNSLKILKN
ncbi:aminoglycoside phosphotransferase family protein [Oceanirhabdus sp. W0125-5]|uniref:aminoglycoside phosphotransferase family protein n=1 Tax=Oceanirhabdus sp. W0125-5 TaxID=2999116 RepID=UPI0022F337CA|nr:aminoglycoside phosphotransferase family protein [Oceanirhabdus sp. W0125-5]WBW98822.1 aminoglycoside phosphotransferase family protein [Oceanirhabdus sp. W0125-5]